MLSAKRLYRSLINILFPDLYELGNSNAKDMLKKHPELQACRGKWLLYFYIYLLKIESLNWFLFLRFNF